MKKSRLHRISTHDGVIGAVPVAGDVFDVFWRSNKRNVRLLREHLASEAQKGR